MLSSDITYLLFHWVTPHDKYLQKEAPYYTALYVNLFCWNIEHQCSRDPTLLI